MSFNLINLYNAISTFTSFSVILFNKVSILFYQFLL
ncbi:hypothetical protein pb186bvf_006581 [Paramecium bursaria]